MSLENYQREYIEAQPNNAIEQNIFQLSKRVAETIENREWKIRVAEFTRDMNEEEQQWVKNILSTYLCVA